MEVHFTPELEKKLADLAALRGQGIDDLVQDLVTAAIDALTQEGNASRTRAAQAAERILDIQKRVKPDPESRTVQDYIKRGRP
jgi:hypothetical protein